MGVSSKELDANLGEGGFRSPVSGQVNWRERSRTILLRDAAVLWMDEEEANRQR